MQEKPGTQINPAGSAVLVITYSFPPNTDIGARRWYKIAKYLRQQGITVYVLTVGKNNAPLRESSEGFFVKTIKGNYPGIIGKGGHGILWKMHYRMALAYLRTRTSGTVYDKGICMEKRFTHEALQLIKAHNITNVVATGAPFSFLRYAVGLKKNIPGLNVICDIRDPWTDGIYYGFSGLSPSRMKAEKAYEQMVVREADYILTPNPSMTNRFKNDYQKITAIEKFKVLWHPYDPDEIGEVKNMPLPVKNLNIITGGTIDLNGIEAIFETFLKCLDNLRLHDEARYNHTRVEIYSHTNRLKPILKKYTHLPVSFKDKVPAPEFFDRLKQADLLLVFLPAYVKDFMITKLTEYMALKKPILLISPKGMVSDYIVQNRLGIWIDTENEEAVKDFPEQVNTYTGSGSPFNSHFDTSQFSGRQIAAQLISYFV